MPVIVTKENAKVDLRVVRGRDWKWNEQDGNGPGTITYTDSRSAEVRWDKGRSDYYRIGLDDAYDLYVYEEIAKKEMYQGILPRELTAYECEHLVAGDKLVCISLRDGILQRTGIVVGEIVEVDHRKHSSSNVVKIKVSDPLGNILVYAHSLGLLPKSDPSSKPMELTDIVHAGDIVKLVDPSKDIDARLYLSQGGNYTISEINSTGAHFRFKEHRSAVWFRKQCFARVTSLSINSPIKSQENDNREHRNSPGNSSAVQVPRFKTAVGYGPPIIGCAVRGRRRSPGN